MRNRAAGRLVSLAVLVIACSTGCAAVAGGAVESQGLQSGLGVVSSVKQRLMGSQLTQVAERAQAYQAQTGSMTGFATLLRAQDPTLAGSLVLLTDSEAEVSLGGGRCLAQPLPSGQQVQQAC